MGPPLRDIFHGYLEAYLSLCFKKNSGILNKKIIFSSKVVTYMVGLISTTFWQFQSYELAQHPCIYLCVELFFWIFAILTYKFQYQILFLF